MTFGFDSENHPSPFTFTEHELNDEIGKVKREIAKVKEILSELSLKQTGKKNNVEALDAFIMYSEATKFKNSDFNSERRIKNAKLTLEADKGVLEMVGEKIDKANEKIKKFEKDLILLDQCRLFVLNVDEPSIDFDNGFSHLDYSVLND
jgi:hypothetical protein